MYGALYYPIKIPETSPDVAGIFLLGRNLFRLQIKRVRQLCAGGGGFDVAFGVGQHDFEFGATEFDDDLAAGAARGDRAVGVAGDGDLLKITGAIASGDGAE